MQQGSHHNCPFLYDKAPSEDKRIKVKVTSMTTVQFSNWWGEEDQADGDCTKDKLTVHLYGTDVDVIPYVSLRT